MGLRVLKALALGAVCASASAAPFSTCATVQTCSVTGGAQTCNVTLEKCPPCIYPNAGKFNCWDYDTTVSTAMVCPFVTQTSTTNYVDCATADNWTKWGAATTSTASPSTSASNASMSSGSSTNNSSNSTASSALNPSSSSSNMTASAAESSGGTNSNVIMFTGIGVGALVLLIVIVAICKRRKRKATMMRNTQPRHLSGADKRGRLKTKHEEAFGAPYNNVLDTSKGAYGSYQRKNSDPVMMHDPSRDSDTYMSDVPTDEALSVDGMLGEAPLTPVVLGGPNNHKTGKSMGKQSAFTSVNDLVTQDVSIRCTTTANVFDEYLRMKQEMNYDNDDAMSEVMSEMSDLDSDTMSMHKFSLESSQGIGGLALARHHDGGLSITDSEYDEHLRNRAESECYSEMSYNDEKYSFSEDDDMGSEFGRSKLGNSGGAAGANGKHGHGGVPDREVEI